MESRESVDRPYEARKMQKEKRERESKLCDSKIPRSINAILL